ncbi:MAG: hypothetical protein CMJ90_00520 [Planctomycetes bacterium]|nr:hypothetical protein [Planctomycetota bacterium]
MRALAILVLVVASTAPAQRSFTSSWSDQPDRLWAGPDFWANRLQDWRVENGRLVCVADQARLSFRTLHLLTRRLGGGAGFTTSVRLGGDGAAPSAHAGFLIGVGGDRLDWRAASIVHQWPGRGAGYYAGVTPDGRVFFEDREQGQVRTQRAAGSSKGQGLVGVSLKLTVTSSGEGRRRLALSATAPSGELVSALALELPVSRCVGNMALVAHPGQGDEGTPVRWWFNDWSVGGDGIETRPERAVGPIICAQHVLSKGALGMTAQLMPIGAADPQEVTLHVKDASGQWQIGARAPVVVPGYTATFRVEEWPSTRDVPYRIEYGVADNAGAQTMHRFEGTVRKDPVAEDEIVVAGFTGNHNNSHQIGAQPTNWIDGMWFPHQDLVERVKVHDPDLLFFSGDQIYEGRSPTFPDRAHIKEDYLYKWYLWCWAYRDLTRDIPCVTIPDDHDVFQGNVWGEYGRKARKDTLGGYVHPADFVQMVDRTQTSHLPASPHPGPLQQGIRAYYTSITYGRIGFAVLEDRKFKSGCGGGRLPETGTRRDDHINDPAFDVSRADVEGLTLLGPEQLGFIDRWGKDWRGEDMKMAMSQTIFGGMATHHGGNLQRLIADLDSNGWPQSGRNRALTALRRCFAFHLGGDQHLATIVHHGVETWGDAIWSMAVPSIANFYPRMWRPEAVGARRPDGAPTWMGEHKDGFGNHVTVWAATNPGPKTGHQPAELHDKMPGYGIVRLKKSARTITMECWPRHAVPGTDRQYPGWPKTIKQADNYGRVAAGWLPEVVVTGGESPVVQVVDEGTSEVIYTLRMNGARFRPWVFDAAKTYTLRVGPGTYTGQKASAAPDDRTIFAEL